MAELTDELEVSDHKGSAANNCISEQYLHKCSDDCTAPSQLLLFRGQAVDLLHVPPKVALHIPLMKLLALPEGGVHRPVTWVPANIVQTTNVLTRSCMEGSLLPVKLKCTLTCKGHCEYQFVDTIRVRQALKCLKTSNANYRDIEFNDAWINEFCQEEDDSGQKIDEEKVVAEKQGKEGHEVQQEIVTR